MNGRGVDPYPSSRLSSASHQGGAAGTHCIDAGSIHGRLRVFTRPGQCAAGRDMPVRSVSVCARARTVRKYELYGPI
jgi:hypothetical protein